jgi:hypothetical protein
MTKLAGLAAVAVIAAVVPEGAADSKVGKRITTKLGPRRAVPVPAPVLDDYELEERRMEARRQALPTPPDGANYAAWFGKLSATQRRDITRFCRDNPTEDEISCGGIGIYRIPVPPRMTGPGDDPDDYKQWERNLTAMQRAQFKRLCAQERHAYSQLCGGTPLVVAFDNQAVQFTPASAGQVTDWPTAITPWLALDRDGDGAITSGAELFGDATVLADGTTAKGGFHALSALDANGDGKIDRADPMFASLVLWADHDGDRTSSARELSPASRVIDSIDVGYRMEPRCDARLNCEREKSIVRYRDAGGAPREGSVVDVYLKFR